MPSTKPSSKKATSRSAKKRGHCASLEKARAARKNQGTPTPSSSQHCMFQSVIKSEKGDAVVDVCETESISDAKNKVLSAKNSSLDSESLNGSEFAFSNEMTLEDLRKANDKFIKDRNWDQFHSPRNVLLALVGEVGELAEIFQWKGEVSEGLPELNQKEREHVGQEMSDVLLYLIDLAARCRIDLPTAVLSKMTANAVKYPVDKAYGRSNKYTDYQN